MAELAKNLVKDLTRCFATTGKTTLFSSSLKYFQKATVHIHRTVLDTLGRRPVDHADKIVRAHGALQKQQDG